MMSDPLYTSASLQPFPIQDGIEMPINGFAVRADGEICQAPPCTDAHLHRHKFFELYWLAKGEASFVTDFQPYALKAGTLVFIAPGQVYKWQLQSGAELVVIGFKPELYTRFGQNLFPLLPNLPFYNAAVRPYICLDGAQQAHMDYLLTTLVNRQSDDAAQRESYLLAYLNVIFVEVQATPYAPSIQSAATELTRAFQLLVECHYGERKQVQAYAAQLGVTVNHLVETVRMTTGTTPGQWIQQRLLLETKRLLAYTPHPVEVIASHFAFKNPSQFSRWFKHLAGMTPGQFRRGLTEMIP